MRFRILLPCLLLSGFSGLAYELLWTRLLSLTFGSTTLSFSTVLAVFFGGLALGSWLAGRRAATLRRPARAYGLIEIGMGLVGIALFPVILHLDRLFAALDPGTGPLGALARLAVATPLLIVPTVLMGATLPVVCSAVVVRDEDLGRGTALIYGLNTLGAFLGAYLTTYHLIPTLGVLRSVLVAAAANGLAGSTALLADWLGRKEDHTGREDSPAGVQPAAAVAAGAPGNVRHVALGLTFLSGFTFLAYEVVWARLFSGLLNGTIYGVGAVLISVLVGIAAGSLLAESLAPNTRALGLWFASLQALIVASVVGLDHALLRVGYVVRVLADGKGGGLVPQHLQLLVVLLALAVPTMCSGASFPILVRLVARHAREGGSAFGRLYAANTVGAILGSLTTGFVLVPVLGSTGASIVATALVCVAAGVAATLLSIGRERLIGLAASLVAFALLAGDPGLDVRLMATGVTVGSTTFTDFRRLQEQALSERAFLAEGHDGTVFVQDYPGSSRSMRINGLAQGSRFKHPPHALQESVLVGTVPFSHASHAKSALVVGLGLGSTVDVMEKLGLTEITVVEIEPRVADAVKVVFEGHSPLDSERVRLQVDDARRFLLGRGRRGEPGYDLITSMPSHPWVAPSLFTREFFEIARSGLAAKGVFSTWFGVAELDGRVTESLLRAFCEVFPYYLVYFVPEAQAYYLVGASHQVELDLPHLRELSRDGPLRDLLPGWDELDLLARLVASGTPSSTRLPPGTVNTDDSAFVETQTPRPSTRKELAPGFLPHQSLLPSFLPQEERRATYAELVERLLGTPGGRLPPRDLGPATDSARQTLQVARGFLGDQLAAYFEGRLALAEGSLDQARARLDVAAAGGEQAIAERARAFRALTHPAGSAARRAALAALPPRTDVLVARLEEEGMAALAAVPQAARDSGDDPIGWLLREATHGRAGQLDAERRRRLLEEAMPAALDAGSPALLEAAAQYAREHDLSRLADVVSRRRILVADSAAEALMRRGLEAGQSGRLAEAAGLLAEAHRLRPMHDRTMRFLLLALDRQGDAVGLTNLAEDYRLQGRPPEYVASLLREARLGRLQFGEHKSPGAAAATAGRSMTGDAAPVGGPPDELPR